MSKAMTFSRIMAGAAIVAGALLLTGCVERTEKVKVRADGQVSVTVNIKADQAAELSPGRVPSQLAGWSVDKGFEEEGKKVTLSAQQTFAPGHPLPGNDASPGDLLGKTYVQFPTTVKVEKRADGTYYQFRRVYQARAYAWLAYFDEREGSKEFKAILGKPTEKVTQQEWEKAVAFGVQTQVLKKLEQARAAVLQLKQPEMTQDKWLAARKQVLEAAEKVETSKVVTMLKNRKQNGQGQEDLSKELESLEASLDKALVDALIGVGCPEKQITMFKGLMNQYKAQDSATNDARGTGYRVSVELPGELVGSNGTVSAGAVNWEIKGEAFCDREVELLATSRVR
jgi:hypothetical protein